MHRVSIQSELTKISTHHWYRTGEEHCTYAAPSVAAWAAVAVAVTSPKLPVPPSSGYTAIALGGFAGITVVAKHLWLPRKYVNQLALTLVSDCRLDIGPGSLTGMLLDL